MFTTSLCFVVLAARFRLGNVPRCAAIVLSSVGWLGRHSTFPSSTSGVPIAMTAHNRFFIHGSINGAKVAHRWCSAMVLCFWLWGICASFTQLRSAWLVEQGLTCYQRISWVVVVFLPKSRLVLNGIVEYTYMCSAQLFHGGLACDASFFSLVVTI